MGAYFNGIHISGNFNKLTVAFADNGSAAWRSVFGLPNV